MRLPIITLFIALTFSSTLHGQTMNLSISDADFQVTTVFNEVGTFDIAIEFNSVLERGVYNNPDIVSVEYSVSGTLVDPTPSGFPGFALQRTMTGAEFYAQGSSINFEIASNAVLSDGVQVGELAGNGIVFTFNGREIGNGRFHPALFELNANGTGQIQNSNNIIVENPLQEVDFGDEYVTTLIFDPGNTTIITGVPLKKNKGGAISPLSIVALLLLWVFGYRKSVRSQETP
ncbi:MAG: hypothetical protein ACR2QT_07350 [Woeseiaceae bacterium]